MYFLLVNNEPKTIALVCVCLMQQHHAKKIFVQIFHHSSFKHSLRSKWQRVVWRRTNRVEISASIIKHIELKCAAFKYDKGRLPFGTDKYFTAVVRITLNKKKTSP